MEAKLPGYLKDKSLNCHYPKGLSQDNSFFALEITQISNVSFYKLSHNDDRGAARFSIQRQFTLIRVLMLGCNPLFRESIERLICREMEVEIVGRETSIDRAFACITTTKPDVIVVDSSDPDFDHGKVILRVLEHDLSIKVIGLNLNDNRIWIYRGEQKVAKAVQDLVDAIKL
jgi:hypothetical protein